MVNVSTDGEIDYIHRWHCKCGFCKMENSRNYALKLKVGWIIRLKSEKWISKFPKINKHKGNWRPFPEVNSKSHQMDLGSWMK